MNAWRVRVGSNVPDRGRGTCVPGVVCAFGGVVSAYEDVARVSCV